MSKKSLCAINLLVISVLYTMNLQSQNVLNLAQCREMAIENNKMLKMASEQERKAHYEKKEALMKYFPKFSASATYLHFSDDLHLIGKDALPSTIPLPPQLGGQTIQLPSEIQSGIYDAATIDMSNFWIMDVSLTQPLFTGGKIIALNDLRKYAEELASTQKQTKMTDVIVEVDEAYWQTVSLVNKKKLADAYVNLLKKLESDTENMYQEGVATKADKLSVVVKLNEAEIALTRAENGLSLSKMLLCQIIGVDITDKINLFDENLDDISDMGYDDQTFDINAAIEDRSEIKSLSYASKIYEAKERIARAEFMPTAGLSLGYTWLKPNLENGLQNKFGGMWNVAVNVKMPLNFISSSAKLKAAKSDTYMHEYQLEESKEKIKLQINQSSYKLTEARKKLTATSKNTDKANENLKYAQIGYEEGVIPASDVLAAQTAWMAAQADKIDAQIDLKLCKLYLDKALGRNLEY